MGSWIGIGGVARRAVAVERISEMAGYATGNGDIDPVEEDGDDVLLAGKKFLSIDDEAFEPGVDASSILEGDVFSLSVA